MTAILPDQKPHTATTGTSFLPDDTRERLAPKLREAVSEFVDSPAEAVEKADRLLAETVEQLHEALVHRHGELRSAWDGEGSAPSAGGAGSAAQARRDDATGFGDNSRFGDGTPTGGGTAPRGGRDGTGTARDTGRARRAADGVTDDPADSAPLPAREPGRERTTSRQGHGAEADTERLRLALQEYRETTERLLSL
ncbi:translation initiation factor IF-2 [Streptomyces sp. P6-2-1]|uniref:translation initiation factor IF-2 n=1 Tax=unclassified Streptomyces TaxID=2593676 RepID=UPI003D36EC91